MGIQIIVKATSVSEIERALGEIASECEIFPIDAESWGVSIPGKLINVIGEDGIRASLSKLVHFDLWAGVWVNPR
ncbi:hypothetical protein [Undibacterium pigrum]|uniref:Uncharacterized protein n=1 Tax=Undibacterium pigrum TaxID=401470 RepID=A0A318II86_9BURK|nr:hypothetical protein [Undibacterium pigrum]PXX33719.1 hypothetical protein DFR42_12915 [Undibacterium pigrum]